MDLESAIVIIPPHDVQAFAAPWRERYARDGLMAHITLLYPWVPPQDVDAALPQLKAVCTRIKPIQINLNRTSVFPGGVYVLEPSPVEPVLALIAELAAAFPDYPPYGGQFGADVRPHLTLADFQDAGDVPDLDLPPAPDFHFVVDRVHVLIGSHPPAAPWVPHWVVPLGASR